MCKVIILFEYVRKEKIIIFVHPSSIIEMLKGEENKNNPRK